MKKLLASLLASIMGAQVQGESPGLQFSHVTSLEIASSEVKKGNLVRVHLFPVELGGDDVPQNVTFIPAGLEDMRLKIIGTIEKFAAEGLVDGLKVEPEYNGASFVPCRIKFVATSSTKKGAFEPTLELWKCA